MSNANMLEKNITDVSKELRHLSDKLQDVSSQLMESGVEVTTMTHGMNDSFFYLFIAFVLACFVGYYVIWNVTPALHSPLMAITNGISSVIVVGAIIAANAQGVSEVLGVLAVFLASVNIFGGFLVTQRMLAMFKKKNK